MLQFHPDDRLTLLPVNHPSLTFFQHHCHTSHHHQQTPFINWPAFPLCSLQCQPLGHWFTPAYATVSPWRPSHSRRGFGSPLSKGVPRSNAWTHLQSTVRLSVWTGNSIMTLWHTLWLTHSHDIDLPLTHPVDVLPAVNCSTFSLNRWIMNCLQNDLYQLTTNISSHP